MKTENEIKKQLEEVYLHRLQLRVERKTKKSCKNCIHGIISEINAGEFGTIQKWDCSLKNKRCDCVEECVFCCANNVNDIEKEMIKDIENPSVCGAKEPKIAALLWVLHDSTSSLTEKVVTTEKEEPKKGFWEKLKGLFHNE